MELKIWQSILQETGIQMDMETLQDLSEDCLINRVTEYLNKSNLHNSNELAKSTITPQIEGVSCPDSDCDAFETKSLNTALPSACNEISITDLCPTDKTRPDPTTAYRPIKLLFRLLANIRNLMAKNKIISLELHNEERSIKEENGKLNCNGKEVAATVDGIKDSINLIQELQQEIPTNFSNISAPADIKTYMKRREQSMVALENLRTEIEGESNAKKDEDLKVEQNKQNLRESELKTTAAIVKENFDLLNQCSEYLLNEISEAILLRQAMGKKIFED